MSARRPNRVLLAAAVAQGLFYVVTSQWPIVSMGTFLMVTGPKVDLWLVRTVGLLIAVSGVVLLMAAWREHLPLEVVVLAIGQATSLTVIDVVYVSVGRIPPVYLLDAIAESTLVVCWFLGLWLKWRTAGGPRHPAPQ